MFISSPRARSLCVYLVYPNTTNSETCAPPELYDGKTFRPERREMNGELLQICAVFTRSAGRFVVQVPFVIVILVRGDLGLQIADMSATKFWPEFVLASRLLSAGFVDFLTAVSFLMLFAQLSFVV